MRHLYNSVFSNHNRIPVSFYDLSCAFHHFIYSMHSIDNLLLNLSQDLFFNSQLHYFSFLCVSLWPSYQSIFDQLLNVGLFDEERHLDYFLHDSFNVFVDIYDIRLYLLDDLYFSRSLDYFGVLIELVNLCHLLHNRYNFFENHRYFFYLLNDVLHLNNLLFNNLNFFILSLHNYSLSIHKLQIILNVRNFMNHVYLLYPYNFLNLWHYNFNLLRNCYHVDCFVHYSNRNLFLQDDRDWDLNRLHNNIISLNHFYVVYIHVLNSVSKHLDWLLFCLHNNTLVYNLVRNLISVCYSIFHKNLLLYYFLFLYCQVDYPLNWHFYRHFSNARSLNDPFDWRHLLRNFNYPFHDFLDYLRHLYYPLDDTRNNHYFLNNFLHLNTSRHFHDLLNNLFNSLNLSFDAVIVIGDGNCLLFF